MPAGCCMTAPAGIHVNQVLPRQNLYGISPTRQSCVGLSYNSKASSIIPQLIPEITDTSETVQAVTSLTNSVPGILFGGRLAWFWNIFFIF